MTVLDRRTSCGQQPAQQTQHKTAVLQRQCFASSNWCNKWQSHPRIPKQLTTRSNRIGTWYRQIRRYDCRNVAFMTTFRSEYFFQTPVSRRMSVVNDPFYHATPFLNRLRMCKENQTKSKPQLLNLIFSEGQLLESSFKNTCFFGSRGSKFAVGLGHKFALVHGAMPKISMAPDVFGPFSWFVHQSRGSSKFTAHLFWLLSWLSWQKGLPPLQPNDAPSKRQHVFGHSHYEYVA